MGLYVVRGGVEDGANVRVARQRTRVCEKVRGKKRLDPNYYEKNSQGQDQRTKAAVGTAEGRRETEAGAMSRMKESRRERRSLMMR